MFRTAPHLTDEQLAILADLGRHPGWAVMRGVTKNRMEQEFRLLAGALMRGEHPDDIEWKRGFFAGMKYLLDEGGNAAKKFEKARNERGDE